MLELEQKTVGLGVGSILTKFMRLSCRVMVA